MIRRLPFRILAAGLLLVAVLIGLVIHEDRARAAGTEAILAMEALDPRDLLTGHYVALRLTQRLEPGAACPERTQPFSDGAWVALKAGDGHHRFVGSAATRQAALALGGDLAVRGGVSCARVAAGAGEDNAVTLDLDVDRFHADQREAERIDALLRDRRLGGPPTAFAVISVGQDGRARLKGVILDGKRTDLTWW